MTERTVSVEMGTQSIELPVVELGSGATIALLMTIDSGIAYVERASAELAELIRPSRPDVIVTAATLGIPVAIAVAKSLGLDDYVVLQKSKKWHLRSSPSVTLTSITTADEQRLTLDARRVPGLRGARVAFVDDVISTGSSARAALALLTESGAEIVSVGALMLEGEAWRDILSDHAPLVVALGELPINP